MKNKYIGSSKKGQDKKTKHQFRLKQMLYLLGTIPFTSISSVQADDYQTDDFENVYWTNSSTGNHEYFDGSNWSSGSYPDDLAKNIYINDTSNGTANITFGSGGFAGNVVGDYDESFFHIGGESGKSADVVLKTEPYTSGNIQADLIIGSNGGSGTLTYHHNNLDNDLDTYYGENPNSHTIQMVGGLTLGSGSGSSGTVNLLGSGKTIQEQQPHSGFATMSVRNIEAGVDGGRGLVNLNGSNLNVDEQGGFDLDGQYYFSLGSGSNSYGEVNVLGGGKLSTSLSSNDKIDPTAVLGLNGGEGVLNISGVVNKQIKVYDESVSDYVLKDEFAQSRVIFGQGLELGNGAGSVGTINVTDGGALYSLAARQENWFASEVEPNTPPGIGAYIGVNGGTGSVTISGVDQTSGKASTWFVAGESPPAPNNESSGRVTVGELHIGHSGAGNLTIADGGVVSIGRMLGWEYVEGSLYGGYQSIFDKSILGKLYLGTEDSGTGSLNIGAQEGQVAAGTGTLEASEIVFGAGDGNLVFNHTDTSGDYIFDTVLVSSADGKGTIKQVAGITNLDTDQSTFTGQSIVSGGELIVNNLLGGDAIVKGGALTVNGTLQGGATVNGGVLAGVGTVGNTVVNRGGVINPGAHSSADMSTLTIDGDLTMNAGSSYRVDIATDDSLADPYISDHLVVNGNAYLNGGSVDVKVSSADVGLLNDSTRWHILSASGDVVGKFSSPKKHFLTETYAVENSYDAQNVYLTVALNQEALDPDFCKGNMTNNQCSVKNNIGNALLNEGVSGPIYDWVLNLDSEVDLTDVYDQLSGEVHVSNKNALLEDSRFLREAVHNRLSENSAGTGWAQVYTSRAKLDGNNNASKVDRDINGLFVGVDGQLSESWSVGAVAGYGQAKVESDRRHSKVDREDYHVGAYGKGEFGAASLEFGVGHTFHDFSTRRNVNLPGLQENLRADYDGNTTQVFLEGNYRLELDQNTAVEPLVNVAYVHVATDGFQEKGGIAVLNGQSETADLFVSTIGTRVTHHIDMANDRQAKLWGTVGWRHGFGDTDKKSYFKFDGAKSNFGINGTAMTKNAAVLEFGAQIPVGPNTDIGLMYNGVLGSDVKDHGAKAYVNWRF